MAIARVTNNTWLSARALSGAATSYVERAFVDNVQAGSLLVAVAQVMGNKSVTFSDSQGNAWVTAIEPAYSGALGVRYAIGYASNASAGATTVRATYPDDASNRSIVIMEYTGCATASPVDGTATSATGSSDTPMAPGNITSTGDAVFIGAAVYASPAGTPTPGTDFTGYERTQDGDYTINIEDRIVSGAATINPAWSNKTFWLALGIAFKAAAGGSSTPIAALAHYYAMLRAAG
jgi:hypothetical protein